MTKAAGMVGRTAHTRGINALCIIALGAALAASLAADPATAAGTLEHEPYGKTKDGRAVDVYTMTNDHGMRVRFLSFGGTVTEISVPDRAGRVDNVVLGLRSVSDWETLPGHFGTITGRYANRIGGANSP